MEKFIVSVNLDAKASEELFNALQKIGKVSRLSTSQPKVEKAVKKTVKKVVKKAVAQPKVEKVAKHVWTYREVYHNNYEVDWAKWRALGKHTSAENVAHNKVLVKRYHALVKSLNA